MLTDAAQIPTDTVLDTRVCVVGAGIAGISLASCLASKGHRVVVLESGGKRAGNTDDQRGDVDKSDHDPLENVSVRRLGGSLALWGGRLAPLDDSDFRPSQFSPSGWPISQEMLRPFLKRATHLLGGGQFEYSAGAAIPGTGTDMPAGSRLDTDKLWRWGPPLRFQHLADALDEATNLHLVYNATAVRLQLGDGTDRVQELVAQTSARRAIRVRALLYVVAAGGLESTRLLLASNDMRSKGLGNENGLLGRGYMTHPTATLGTAITSPAVAKSLCAFQRTRDGVYARRILRLRHETVNEDPPLNNLYLTFWNPDPHNPEHGDGLLSLYALVKALATRTGLTGKVGGAHRVNLGRSLNLRPHLHNLLTTLPQTTTSAAAWAWGRWGRERSLPALLHPGQSGRLQLRFDAEQSASASNYVELTRDFDSQSMPRLRVVYRVADDDRERYFAALGLLAGELTHIGIDSVSLPSRDDFMTMRLGDGTHQMGLTRMSASPSTGVVDPDCRLHSCRNVFVVGSSVFPSSGAAPPTLTLTALALRAADQISAELST